MVFFRNSRQLSSSWSMCELTHKNFLTESVLRQVSWHAPINVLHKLQVEIDVLKGKSVFLFISDLEISNDDISMLQKIFDKARKEEKEQYKIVWIPFVEQLREGLDKEFETKRSTMPWYVARYYLPKASCRFIKKQWNFKVKPLLVALNPQGKMECENAILIFSIYGVEAFPFTSAKVKTRETDFSWLWSPIINANSEIENWVKSFHRSNACANTNI